MRGSSSNLYRQITITCLTICCFFYFPFILHVISILSLSYLKHEDILILLSLGVLSIYQILINTFMFSITREECGESNFKSYTCSTNKMNPTDNSARTNSINSKAWEGFSKLFNVYGKTKSPKKRHPRPNNVVVHVV